MLKKIANTIRHLTMDAVERAGSGHPGMPMGCAELGAYLFGEFLRFDPSHPKWPQRDRLILSVGYGSLWLYSCKVEQVSPVSILGLISSTTSDGIGLADNRSILSAKAIKPAFIGSPSGWKMMPNLLPFYNRLPHIEIPKNSSHTPLI